ncbi:MAG: endonuclease/exonuclease/phosphatase family protein [Phycisphaerales bacterium]
MIASKRIVLTLCIGLLALIARSGFGAESSVAVRVMTFNLEDVRHEHASTPDDDRLRRLAEVIQRIRPNVLLLNEVETLSDPEKESTADLFVRHYLMVPQAAGLEGIGYVSYTPGTNTGVPSGFDLDRSGSVHDIAPARSLRQTREHRAYGGDCFGFGTFPGQYGMALLVDPKLTIVEDQIRTYQRFLWNDLPDVQVPMLSDGTPYYSDDAWEELRLSSKTHAIVPIRLPNQTVLHAIISHPTPPAFDGPERRNKIRNSDEIRLISAMIENHAYLYDDQGIAGGLAEGSLFVVMGDLNADPNDGSSIGDPIDTFLLGSNRFAVDVSPSSSVAIEGLDPTDTSGFGLRVDYVLPSADLEILESGVWRHGSGQDSGFGSDHFPVWVDLLVPSN